MDKLKLLNDIDEALAEVEAKRKAHVQIQQVLNHFRDKLQTEINKPEEQENG